MATCIKALLIWAFLFLNLSTNAQLTETFKTIDEKNCFKDVVFGSNYLTVNNKMKLTKRPGTKNLNRYNVNLRKYLSIGIYKTTDTFVEFSKDKLSMIVLTIPNNYKEVVNYFTTLFGKPEFQNMWLWTGENISYAIGGDSNTGYAMVIISSNKIKFDNGEDNL